MGVKAPLARRQVSGLFCTCLLLELEGGAVPNVVADVFLVDQNLMNRAAGPRATKIGEDASLIEARGDLPLLLAVLDEGPVDPADDVDLFGRAGNKDDAIRLDALVFAACQLPFTSNLIHESSAQSEAGRSALPEAEFDQPALTGEHLRGKLAAVFPGHGALDAFDDGGDRAAIVVELLGAILDLDAGPLADELVVSAFVRILEAPPTANIVDKMVLKSA